MSLRKDKSLPCSGLTRPVVGTGCRVKISDLIIAKKLDSGLHADFSLFFSLGQLSIIKTVGTGGERHEPTLMEAIELE